jgi:hypothetical protein
MNDEFEPLVKPEREFKAMVAKKILAGDCWIFLPGIDGFPALKQIEQRFYSSSRAEDFQTIVVPFDKIGVFGFVFAAKRRLSAAALAAFLRGQSLDSQPPTAADLLKHVVITLAEREEGEMLMRNFKDWVDASVQAEAELRRYRGRWN